MLHDSPTSYGAIEREREREEGRERERKGGERESERERERELSEEKGPEKVVYDLNMGPLQRLSWDRYG